MINANSPPLNLQALNLNQEDAVAGARDTLNIIKRVPESNQPIEKSIKKTEPRLPALLSVLEQRSISQVLKSVPNARFTIAGDSMSREALRTGVQTLGSNHPTVERTRARAERSQDLKKIHTGSGMLGETVEADRTIIPDRNDRYTAKQRYMRIRATAINELGPEDSLLSRDERLLKTEITNFILQFNQGAEDAFLRLSDGPMRKHLGEQIVLRYEELYREQQFAVIENNPHLINMIENYLPQVAWTDSAEHKLEEIIDNRCMRKTQIRDILIHERHNKSAWAYANKTFIADGRPWLTQYFKKGKHSANLGRVICAETTDDPSNFRRVILWHDTGSNVKHDNNVLKEKLQIGRDASWIKFENSKAGPAPRKL